MEEEDEAHLDAEEYVAVQAGIDEVKGHSVFVVATVNELYKLPSSLIRLGRFDRKIEVCRPSAEDAYRIVEHYVKNKKIAQDVSLEDVTKMLSHGSCAELESILNGAAINAAFARRDAIMMEDIVASVLQTEYEALDATVEMSAEDRRIIAIHEAGHLVVSEVLCPGSVGLTSMRPCGGGTRGGFVRRCKELPSLFYDVLILLGGISAVNLYYAEDVHYGESGDLQKAARILRKLALSSGAYGFGQLNIERSDYEMSENMNSRNEAVIQAELARYIIKAKDILFKNKELLEKTVEALLEKQTLLYSDIQALRKTVSIASGTV